jgi:NitT/TauT family transport system ATP-binding protein
MRIQLSNVRKHFRSIRGEVAALDRVSLDIPAGGFVCVVGPSGCGKSTLLNLIAGLDKPDSGEVLANGTRVEGPGKERGMIFQEHGLFPWLNVLDNIAFGLSIDGVDLRARTTQAMRLLSLVHLDGFEKAYIHELSGGMKQRVALARALALDPQVLLMDEPFAALDAQTRDTLHAELQEVISQTKTTVVFVTHNVREALVLGDRVILMASSPGRIHKEYAFNQPHPRHIEDHALIDQAREILAELKTVSRPRSVPSNASVAG